MSSWETILSHHTSRTPFSVFGFHLAVERNVLGLETPLPGTQRREWKRKSFVTAGKTWPTNVDWYPMPGLSPIAVTRISSFPHLFLFLEDPLFPPPQKKPRKKMAADRSSMKKEECEGAPVETEDDCGFRESRPVGRQSIFSPLGATPCTIFSGPLASKSENNRVARCGENSFT